MIIATGNNFGAGQIEFKEYLSDNMIILNGRFSFDYTKRNILTLMFLRFMFRNFR